MSKPLVSFNGTFCLVGSGQMGGAVLKGLLAMGLSPSQVVVLDPSPPQKMAEMLDKHGISLNPAVMPKLDVMMLAVKPQIAKVVMTSVSGYASLNTLILSVMAGTTIDAMQLYFGDNTPVIRTIPNTPASVGRGITAAFANHNVNGEQKTLANTLLTAIGAVEWVESEGLIDVATAVSGSGPAYVFLLAELLAEAGAKAGLPADLALRLARRTVEGAGELLFQAEQTSPSTLRQNVTSPNGTTFAALQIMMAENGLQPIFDMAIKAAADRSKELSQ